MQTMTRTRKRNTLLTFVGSRDPLNETRAEGPILSVLRARRFHRVYLFHNNEAFRRRAERTREFIRKRELCDDVNTFDCPTDDPTDYSTLYPALLDAICAIMEIEGRGAQFCVNLASGTPQMETCWILLRQSGLLEATLLRPADPRHGGKQPFQEVSFEIDAFPRITAPSSIKRRLNRLSRRLRQLETERAAMESEDAWAALIGEAPAFVEAIRTAKALATYDVPVVITGETGTGKELVARALHFGGHRRAGPFIELNCAALPDELVEMELFGHAKGAFTDAHEDRPGRFELADGGTLFLDELAEMSEQAQRKLLRIVETGKVERLGEAKVRSIDVRLVAATNHDINEALASGVLREDLWYRLSVGRVALPALRDRLEDVPLLAAHFLEEVSRKYGKRKTFADGVLDELCRGDWPGNVRELRNLVERAYILCPAERIPVDAVAASEPAFALTPTESPAIVLPPEGMDFRAEQEKRERAYYEQALERCSGNAANAARLLGLKPNSFRKRARSLGVLA